MMLHNLQKIQLIHLWKQYIKLMDWEIASKKWYRGVRCKLTDDDGPFLNYLYFLPITEIYLTIREQSPTILPILEKISPCDAHTLQQELEAAPSERTRSFIKKHQQFLQASFNRCCHYHDIDYSCFVTTNRGLIHNHNLSLAPFYTRKGL